MVDFQALADPFAILSAMAPFATEDAVHYVVSAALIVGVGIGLTCIAAVLRLPALPFLLAAGIALGPGLGVLDPDADLGPMLRPLISLAVAVILFEGGLSLSFREVRGTGRALWGLILAGLFVGALLIGLLGVIIVGLSVGTSAVLGAILVVTGPTVILPMLRRARLPMRPAALLKWEGIVNDPLGALLALFVFQVAVLEPAGDDGLFGLGLVLLIDALIALAIGGGAAWLVERTLRFPRLPKHLHSPLILAVVLPVFAAAEWLGEETGLLAVTVMGLALGNLPSIDIREVRHFKEQINVILVSMLFVILAARLDGGAMAALVGWPAVLVLAIVFVARPLIVLIGTLGSGLPWNERAILAWVAPRGIVAAAVAGAFEPRLLQAGFDDARLLVPIVFGVIAFTVVLQGFTIRPVARLLGLGSPDGSGVLIVGARAFSVALAHALGRAGAEVHVTDTVFRRVSHARREGLSVHYEDVLSEEAELTLPLERISCVLAATDDDTYNTVVRHRYVLDFGPHATLQLTPETSAETVMSDALATACPWGERGTYRNLSRAYWRQEEVRVTQFTDQFGAEDLLRQDPDAMLLFSVKDGRLQPIPADSRPRGKMRVVYLPGRPPVPEATTEVAAATAAEVAAE